MQISIISYESPDVHYNSVIHHECTCGNFFEELKKETKKYVAEEGEISEIDLFWHLDEYCKTRYGKCQWQMISTTSLLLVTAHPTSE